MLTDAIRLTMVGTVIKSLISQGKRVIIPDLGAFLVKDSTLSTILTKENVTFSPFLKYNDGFLEGELAHRFGLHKDDASLQVVAFVDALKTAIYVDKKAFEVEGLGFFFKDMQGNITFSIARPFAENDGAIIGGGIVKEEVQEPEMVEKVVLHKDSEEVVAPDDNREVDAKFDLDEVAPVEPSNSRPPFSVEKVNPVVPHDIEEEEVTVEIEDQADDELVKEFEDEEKKETAITIGSRNNIPPSKRKSKSLLVGFVLLVGVLLVLNVFWTDFFGSNTNSSKPKIVLDPIDQEQKDAENDRIEAKEVAQDAIDNEVVSTVEKAVRATSKDEGEVEKSKKAEQEKPAKAKKTSKESADKEKQSSFVVVLGSFATNENAEKHVAYLAKKKVKGHIVHRNDKYSVVSATYKTYDDAQKEKERIKELGVDGWISSK